MLGTAAAAGALTGSAWNAGGTIPLIFRTTSAGVTVVAFNKVPGTGLSPDEVDSSEDFAFTRAGGF